MNQKPSKCTVEIWGGDFHLNPVNGRTKGIGAGCNSSCSVNDHRGTGSMVSQGSLWIIVGISVAAIAVVGIVVTKKKSTSSN